MHVQHYNRSEGEIKELLVNIVEKINWEVVPNWLIIYTVEDLGREIQLNITMEL